MTQLIWDDLGSRVYESGLDRGVLYLPNGSAVPWNGLTSVVEKTKNSNRPIYFDGVKINDIIRIGDFSATLKAITYPDEFIEIEGFGLLKDGVYLDEQLPKTFNLSYRVMVGDGLNGQKAGYKIHVLYNLTAIPSDKVYETLSDSVSAIEFEWALTSIPHSFTGFRPTSHIVIDSTEVNPLLLADIEKFLYGNAFYDPNLPSAGELLKYISMWAPGRIIDNGDGTWTAIPSDENSIVEDPDGFFTITDANATYTNATTYVISDS